MNYENEHMIWSCKAIKFKNLERVQPNSRGN